MAQSTYTEDNIRSLDWKEHIRMRAGMYIGKLGDGTAADDGIYILLKEAIDNSIDEFAMGFGKEINIKIEDGKATIRDYGRGIPLGKVADVVSKINTGGKFDSKAFKKSVGLNGVGLKAVNALSSYFHVQAYREGKTKAVEFSRGNITNDFKLGKSKEENGTLIVFEPDNTVFKNYKFRNEFIENQIWNYAYLNAGLRINFNEKSFYSRFGLRDLLNRKTNTENHRYPIIHFKAEDIEIAMTHGNQYGEQYYSFVNGQHTTQGGTHQNVFRQAVVDTVRDFYGKPYDASDVRTAIIAAVSIRVEEPIFESQTKTKLGSTHMGPEAETVRKFIGDFIKKKPR
jgi:topoisomerase-4 subunit B